MDPRPGRRARRAGLGMIDPDQLVSVAEIADAAGVTRGLVSAWSVRDLGFPPPVAHLALGPLWLWPDVAAWLAATNRDTTPSGEQVHRRASPIDTHAEMLATVDQFTTNGLSLADACATVAAHHRAPGTTSRQLAHRLRHLYPGWKARERTRST